MAGTATLAPDRLLVEMESGDRATQRVFELARRVAASQSNLLILGESGTGKSLLARHVHAAGPRALGPFVEITCANLPDELIESELFGHERGAFTGAVAARIGKFEQARGGTVLIDGVTELSSTMQAKLLRVLQERTFERLGGNQTVEVEARILASCEPRIEDMVAAGVLRQDLFYRLNVVRLELPALRDRAGDAARLARRFLAELRPAGGPDRFSTEALEFFATYPWPGNLRELRNTVEGAALTCRGSEIGLEDLANGPLRGARTLVTHAAERAMTLAQLEEAYLREILRRTGGNYSSAARLLGIHRKTLLEKRRRYGID